MTTQIFWIIIVLIISNFLIAISKVVNNEQKRAKMTIIWEKPDVGIRIPIKKFITIYDTDYKYRLEYEQAQIVVHNDSEVLGLKKGRYGLIRGEFVEVLN